MNDSCMALFFEKGVGLRFFEIGDRIGKTAGNDLFWA